VICPRCSVAEISPDTNRCELCGYTLLGAKSVATETPVADEVFETLQRELADRFELQVLVRRERGSMVYLARDLEDDQLVSVRLITRQGPVEGPLLHRFAQTGALASQFHHPHLLSVRKHGMTHSLLWYSSDPIKSRTLHRVLEGSGPMTLPKALELLEQVASGLEYLHRNAVVHGGVARRTILVDAEGWVRISDPGMMAAIYRAAGPGLGWESLLDLPFAAPELLERKLMGPAADQYSLAVVAHACLLGQPPWTGESVEAIQAARGGEPVRLRDRLPDLPVHVVTALERALRTDPTERFASVLDFVAVMGGAALRPSGAMLAGRPGSGVAQPVVVVPEGEPPVRRRRWGSILGAWAVVTVAAGIGGYLAWSKMGGRSEPEWASAGAAAESPAPRATQPVAAPDSSVRATQPARRPAPPVSPPRSARATTPPPPPVQAPATLFLNATPWGALYVDGELVGNTPQANVRVTPGKHRIRIVRDGFVPFEQDIEVATGDTLRLTDIVLTPIGQ
jgi:hypothetical protein